MSWSAIRIRRAPPPPPRRCTACARSSSQTWRKRCLRSELWYYNVRWEHARRCADGRHLPLIAHGKDQPMSKPRWIDVQAPKVELKALTWGPSDGPIALCLHGFPDTAYGWRNFAPRLAESGWRVVAPFMRGYAPSSIPSDGSYHIGALMHDALEARRAAAGTDRDVVIGHDWGAMAANGLAAIPGSPFAKAVIMSVPPAAAFQPLSRLPDRGRLLGQIPPQLLRSWYIVYFQLPWLPERSASWLLPRLWKRWSPGYDAKADLRDVDAAIGTPESWRAALGHYRAPILH